MIRIQLSPRELQLFEEIAIFSTYEIKYDICEHDIIISDDVNNLELITYMILDYFCSKGLEKNDEPNALGMELETLNSKFINQLQILNDSLMRV
jgi:hypothetical protein